MIAKSSSVVSRIEQRLILLILRNDNVYNVMDCSRVSYEQ